MKSLHNECSLEYCSLYIQIYHCERVSLEPKYLSNDVDSRTGVVARNINNTEPKLDCPVLIFLFSFSLLLA